MIPAACYIWLFKWAVLVSYVGIVVFLCHALLTYIYRRFK